MLVGTYETYEPSTPGHECTKRPIIASVLESVPLETREHVIETAGRVAEETGLQPKVYNVSSRLGRRRALLKGVKITPAVVLGDHRISEEITEEKTPSPWAQTRVMCKRRKPSISVDLKRQRGNARMHLGTRELPRNYPNAPSTSTIRRGAQQPL